MSEGSPEIPPPCDAEVYARGRLVLITHTIEPAAMEVWVKKVAARSGQRVDWHYAGGRVCVLALGDLPRVYAALGALMPEHDRLQTQAATEGWRHYTKRHPFRPSCSLYGAHEMNAAHEYMRQVNTERQGESKGLL